MIANHAVARANTCSGLCCCRWMAGCGREVVLRRCICPAAQSAKRATREKVRRTERQQEHVCNRMLQADRHESRDREPDTDHLTGNCARRRRRPHQNRHVHVCAHVYRWQLAESSSGRSRSFAAPASHTAMQTSQLHMIALTTVGPKELPVFLSTVATAYSLTPPYKRPVYLAASAKRPHPMRLPAYETTQLRTSYRERRRGAVQSVSASARRCS